MRKIGHVLFKDNARVIRHVLELCESGTTNSRNVACCVLRNLPSFVDVFC